MITCLNLKTVSKLLLVWGSQVALLFLPRWEHVVEEEGLHVPCTFYLSRASISCHTSVSFIFEASIWMYLRKKNRKGISVLQHYRKCSSLEWNSLIFFSILIIWVYEFRWIKVKMKLSRHDEINRSHCNGWAEPTRMVLFSATRG